MQPFSNVDTQPIATGDAERGNEHHDRLKASAPPEPMPLAAEPGRWQISQSDMSLMAAEYTLGVLHGAKLERFEQALTSDSQLKLFVLKWTSVFAHIPPLTSGPINHEMLDQIERKIALEEKVWERLGRNSPLRQSMVVTMAVLKVLRGRLKAMREQQGDNDWQ